MKGLLIFSWLVMAGAGYYAWTFYQQTLAAQVAASQALADSTAANDQLKAQIKLITSQLVFAKQQLEAKKPQAFVPEPVPASPPEPPSAKHFPSTITTRMGKVYTGCRIDRAYPDGITIIYDQGVAKIPYDDLDPAFAASFGYDPKAAEDFARQETVRAQQSDANRAAVESHQKQLAAETSSAPATIVAPAPPKKTAGEIASIQSQIAKLREDIAFMQSQQAKLYTDKGVPVDANRGSYPERIADEQRQLDVLQAELNQ